MQPSVPLPEGAETGLAPCHLEMVRRLRAGGKWIRTFGSARETLWFRGFVLLSPGLRFSRSVEPPIHPCSGRDRRFESISLQRRVCKLSVPEALPERFV